MFPYLSAVMPQIAYAHSVRDFIRELLRRFIPGKWIDRVISDQDAKFDAKLDAAFAGLDEKTATEKDYCATVVSVLCDEVSSVYEVTRLVCINRGYRKYADTFLSTEKFIRMLLRQDLEKLERLNATLDDRAKPLCVLLRDVGAVLEDKLEGGAATFCAAELKKANAELKAIAADVKSTMQTGFAQSNQKLLECKSEIIATVGAKVDAVAAKVKRGSRRGRYTEAQIDFCGKAWESACDIQEIRNSTNTKVSYEAAFQFFHRQLAKLGVESVDDFKSIIRAHQARELRRHQREKSAALSDNKTPPKNGIIRGMKKNAKSAVLAALAIVGGMAAPLRSGASERALTAPPPSKLRRSLRAA